jgi:hypothetical protein
MTPEVPIVLSGIARSLMMEIASEVKSQYGALTIQLGSALLMMIAQEFDRAAARLAGENAAIVELFNEADGIVRNGALREALREAAKTPQGSLLVSDLRQRNRDLRALLIQLHAHVETLDGPAARRLDERLWTELVESTRRRHLDLAIG